jgi:hypothetical protein
VQEISTSGSDNVWLRAGWWEHTWVSYIPHPISKNNYKNSRHPFATFPPTSACKLLWTCQHWHHHARLVLHLTLLVELVPHHFLHCWVWPFLSTWSPSRG